MKTLYVTDLDGTLLNRKDRISDYSKEVLHQLLEQGMPITYATARSLTSVAVVVEGLFPKLPIVVYNGAFVLDAETQEVITSSGFSEAEKTFIVELLHNHKISPLVYAFIEGVEKVSWLLERENEGIQYYINNRKGDKRFRPINAVSQL